jgi:hypothetical protein
MVKFETNAKFRDLSRLLSATVSPRAYWFHNSCGGEGWRIVNPHSPTKIVVIDDDQLATFIQLKVT